MRLFFWKEFYLVIHPLFLSKTPSLASSKCRDEGAASPRRWGSSRQTLSIKKIFSTTTKIRIGGLLDSCVRRNDVWGVAMVALKIHATALQRFHSSLRDDYANIPGTTVAGAGAGGSSEAAGVPSLLSPVDELVGEEEVPPATSGLCCRR